MASSRRTAVTVGAPPPRPPSRSRSRAPHGSSANTTACRQRSGAKSGAFASKYASIVPWWSRWSRLRLVNAATSKTIPSTRCCVRAWEDTSMATARRPPATIPASVRCRSGASGVVRAPPSVPTTPVVRPSASRTDRTSCVTVVLPLVPVTATDSSARAGCPQKAAATHAMAGRTPPTGTRTWVTPRSSKCSHRSDAAPRSTASAACACPSVVWPGTQQNSAPAATRRLSNSTEVTTVDAGSPRTSATGTPSSRSATITTSTSGGSAAGWRGGRRDPGPPRALP